MSSTEPARKLDVLGVTEPGSNRKLYNHVMLPGENVLMEFKAFRDVAVFTDKKIIAVNVQGLTGTKVEVLVLPYSKMTAYAVESAGGFDLDAELKVWSSGIGLVEFEFVRGQVDVRALATILSRVVGVSESKQPTVASNAPTTSTPPPSPPPVPPVEASVVAPIPVPPVSESEQSPCPACGAMGEKERKFCAKCGASMEEKRICKACGEVAEEGQNFCRKCGTAIG